MTRPRKKFVAMLVVVSVPADTTAAQARREVRTRIEQLSGHFCHIDDDGVKVRRIEPRGVEL